MSNFEIKVDQRKLQQLIATEPERVDKWLRGVAQQIVGDIKLSFGTSPDGREYERGTVTHIASQPNYPPNVDTGTLRASIDSRPVASRKLTYEIHDGVEYGYHLEMGTERMEARPFVAPVFNDWQRKIMDDAKRNLDID